MVQFNGQKKGPIFPESETLFFSKDVDAQVEFGRDAPATRRSFSVRGQASPNGAAQVKVDAHVACRRRHVLGHVGRFANNLSDVNP
jgi:hypothetical protein